MGGKRNNNKDQLKSNNSKSTISKKEVKRDIPKPRQAKDLVKDGIQSLQAMSIVGSIVTDIYNQAYYENFLEPIRLEF